jgi:ubiquinone/menaquinone biosynthesis C-methylase UbiE
MQRTTQAFDAIADTYDADFGENPIGKWMRAVVWERYLTHFKSGDTVLELNCGTGIDAVFLAQRGIHVVATDASPKMIEQIQRKVMHLSLQKFITTKVVAFDELSQLSSHAAEFDGVVSNFGGLNCGPHPTNISETLASLLKPGGTFIACLMSNFCLWEILAFMVHGKFRQAFRRKVRNGVDVQIGDHSVRTFYFSPKDFIHACERYFTTQRILGLGILVPPPGWVSFYHKHPKLFHHLAKIEKRVRHWFPLRKWGDHFIVELNRK